jgi:uncharacterized membrane protein YhaH (DUF805 family)
MLVLAGSLIVKRFSETPRRPWLIWFFDVAKQGLGSVYAHFLNMFVVCMTVWSMCVHPTAVDHLCAAQYIESAA